MSSFSKSWQKFKADNGNLLEVTDFSITSWLALGASLQLACQWLLPSNLSFWMPLVYIVLLMLRTTITSVQISRNGYNDIVKGRYMATLPAIDPSEATSTNDGMVCFILGARMNHPLGKLAPGNKEIGEMFNAMWTEAEENRQKWSYLGRTDDLHEIADGEGLTMYWISYWRDLKGLQQFATSAVHRAGINAYNKGRMPNIGIWHETFHSPKGSWETIYDNAPPVGFGRAKYVIGTEADGLKLGDTITEDLKNSSMYKRMGRK